VIAVVMRLLFAAPSPHCHRRRPEDEENGGSRLRNEPSPAERHYVAREVGVLLADRDVRSETQSAKGCFPDEWVHIDIAGTLTKRQLVEWRDESEEGVATKFPKKDFDVLD
jgi:hypothetical protein